MPPQAVRRYVQQAFFGFCIKAGRRVLDLMMEADREPLCGPKDVPFAGRRALRGGHTSSIVVLGGQPQALVPGADQRLVQSPSRGVVDAAAHQARSGH